MTLKSATLSTNNKRLRRRRHVRSGLRRNSDLPRLSVFRSNKHIYAQVINDVEGRTVAHVGSAAKELAGSLGGKNKTERARVIGAAIAKKALEAGVDRVVFDRGDSKYHGRVKALAEAARESGLKF